MKGQVALELLIVTGVAFALFIPFLGAFLRFLDDSLELKIAAVDAQSIASINNTTVFFPKRYYLTFINDKAITVTIRTFSGIKGASYISNYQMYGVLPIKPGIYRIMKWNQSNGTVYLNFSS